MPMMTFSPLLAGVGSKTIEKWRDSIRNTCLHNEWGTKKKKEACVRLRVRMGSRSKQALRHGRRRRRRQQAQVTFYGAESNSTSRPLQRRPSSTKPLAHRKKMDIICSQQWASYTVIADTELYNKGRRKRKEGKRREKEIDKMTCENKHQSMERNGEEISCQNETHRSHPTNATEEILYEHLSSPPYNTATPQPHSPRSRWAAATAPLYGQSDIAQPAYALPSRKKKRQIYIFAAKTNFIRRSKNSATHDKQPYGGSVLSKTIMQHHFLHWEQKEKHKRLKAATQRTNPAWSSCYDGFQLSAAATGKWTQKWRKKGTDTISSMQMSSPFAVL